MPYVAFVNLAWYFGKIYVMTYAYNMLYLVMCYVSYEHCLGRNLFVPLPFYD